MTSATEPHEFVVDESAKDSRFPNLCLVCGYSEKSKSTQHTTNREELQRLSIEQLASRLNVPFERIGVAHITEPLKLSTTDLEPGDIVVYLKPDYGVINMDDLKEEWWTASAD